MATVIATPPDTPITGGHAAVTGDGYCPRDQRRLAAVTELCDRLGVISALDTAVGPVKQRDRGFGAGELLTGIAAAQLAGEDFLVGLSPGERPLSVVSPLSRCEVDAAAGW
jgi:hypothetical protein